MMNLFQLQEQLKDFSKDQLAREMASPSGMAPPFLVMSELQRRTRMENAAALDKGPPTSTVAQDAVNAAGVPQGGIAAMARSLAPQTDMTQNTGAVAPVQTMQEGGLAGISRSVKDYGVLTDPALVMMAERQGMTPDEYFASLPREAQARHAARVAQAVRPDQDRQYTPTQEDLDLRFREPEVTSEMLTERGISQGGANPSYVESDVVPTYFPDAEINSTMSGGIASLVAPDEVAPYTLPPQRPGTAEDYAEVLSALSEGRPAQIAPRRRDAPGAPVSPEADVVDVRTSAADSPLIPADNFDDPLGIYSAEDAANNQRARIEQRALAPITNKMDSDAAARSFSVGDMTPEQQEYFATLAPEQQTNVLLYGVPDVSNTRTVASESNALDALVQEASDLFTRSNLGVTAAPTEDLGAMTPEELLPVAPEAPVLAPEPPATTTTAPSGTASGVAAGVGMPTTIPATAEDRMLQQDKWLALARFGAALSASRAPTFGQAVGEAGQVGLDALSRARQDYLQRKKDADDMAMARATLAARTARGSGGSAAPQETFGLSASQSRGLAALDEEIARANQDMLEAEAAVADATGVFARPSAEQVQAYNTLRDRVRALEGQRSAITRFGAGIPQSSGVAPPPPIGYDIRD